MGEIMYTSSWICRNNYCIWQKWTERKWGCVNLRCTFDDIKSDRKWPKENGHVVPYRRHLGGRQRDVRIVENEVTTINYIEEDRARSIREVIRRVGVLRPTVHSIVNENRLYPYHLSLCSCAIFIARRLSHKNTFL